MRGTKATGYIGKKKFLVGGGGGEQGKGSRFFFVWVFVFGEDGGGGGGWTEKGDNFRGNMSQINSSEGWKNILLINVGRQR